MQRSQPMKSRKLKFAVGFLLFAELVTPFLLVAQKTSYKLIDIGTLGGPTANGPGNGPGSELLNNAGQVAGTADTSEPDPNAPNCTNFDCFVSHAFRWNGGNLTDLGALSGVNWTHGNAINTRGWSRELPQMGKSIRSTLAVFNPFARSSMLSFGTALRSSTSGRWADWRVMRHTSMMVAK